MARTNQSNHHTQTPNQMNQMTISNQALGHVGQSSGEMDCQINTHQYVQSNVQSNEMMLNNHTMANYRMTSGSIVNNVTSTNQIHSSSVTPGYPPTYSNSPQITSTITNQHHTNSAPPSTLNYYPPMMLANNLTHDNLSNIPQNSTQDNLRDHQQTNQQRNLQTNSPAILQRSLQTNFQNNQLMQTSHHHPPQNLSNSLPSNLENNLFQLPIHDQRLIVQRFIKREQSNTGQPQQLVPNQQVNSLNNIVSTGNAAESVEGASVQYLQNRPYSVEHTNRDQSAYNSQNNNTSLVNSQLTNPLNNQLQCRLTNYTNSQLVEHLNDPKNQLIMGLQPNILHNKPISNVMSNEFQLQNNLIIRNTSRGLTAFQPINMEEQERIKQERKRQRNR